MKIFEVIGGYTPFEADNIRVAMSKKKEDIIQKEERRFIESAKERGHSEQFAFDLYKQMLRFAEYGFNKSHSIAYALIAYQMAYFKAIFSDLKLNKVKILKPNINVSTLDYLYKNNILLMPLNSVKGLNGNIIKDLIKLRGKGFIDIYDFMIKTSSFMNELLYKTLVLSGVLDVFKINKKTLMASFDILQNYAKMGDLSLVKPLLEKTSEYSNDELLSFDNEYYGFYVGNHPCSGYKNVVKIKNVQNYLFKNVKMALLVDKVTRIKTKNNEEMAFVMVSDETGSMEMTLFPESYKMIPDIKFNDVVLVDAKCTRRFDKYQIVVNNIKRKS